MKKIQVYTTSTCPHCRTAKAYLKDKGYPYVERQVDVDPAAQAQLQRYGARGVPTIVVGDEVIVGFNPEAIEKAVDFVIAPCPACGRKLSLPKGKGKLRITCPHCRETFEKVT